MLGDWKRSDGKEQDKDSSDGYGTGFVIYLGVYLPCTFSLPHAFKMSYGYQLLVLWQMFAAEE